MNKNITPQLEDFLVAFDELEHLYPRVLPLTMWRAWELATYRHITLQTPLLDLGCGDGKFIKQIWPDIEQLVGIDIEENVVKKAKQAGIYLFR